MIILRHFRGRAHALLSKNMKLNTATPKQITIFKKKLEMIYQNFKNNGGLKRLKKEGMRVNLRKTNLMVSEMEKETLRQ